MMDVISKEAIERMISECIDKPRYVGIIFASIMSKIALISNEIDSSATLRQADANGLVSRIMHNRNGCLVLFRNGSSISIKGASENCRGLRAHTVLIDDLIDDSVVNEVIRPYVRDYHNTEEIFRREYMCKFISNEDNDDIKLPANFDKEIVDFINSFKLKERR